MRRNEGSGRGSSALQGNGSKMADCIHIKCSNDWEETATTPDAARITTSKGSIGYKLVAADYHHKQLSDLVHRITARLRYTMARAASKTNMSWSSTSRHANGNIAPPRYGEGGNKELTGCSQWGAESRTSPADACTRFLGVRCGDQTTPSASRPSTPWSSRMWVRGRQGPGVQALKVAVHKEGGWLAVARKKKEKNPGWGPHLLAPPRLHGVLSQAG